MAKSKGGVTVSKVWELCQPIIEEMGILIWDIRYVKEGADYFLRVFIDKPDGIGIEDCEKVSRAINDPLDALDPIENAYCLEVCSPGIERELVRDEHFMQFIGADIMIKMHKPIEGIGKDFAGVLKDYDNGMVTISDHSGENEVTINKKDAVWIKLDDFD